MAQAQVYIWIGKINQWHNDVRILGESRESIEFK